MVAGSVDAFDTPSFLQQAYAYFSTAQSIAVTVAPASVSLTLTGTYANSSAAQSASTKLQTDTLEGISTSLQLNVTNVTVLSITEALVLAPSPPPPSPPPPSPPPQAGPQPPAPSLNCANEVWQPDVTLAATSTTGFGLFPNLTDPSQFYELHPSPRSSSSIVETLLWPSGGLLSTFGTGGVGKLPKLSFSQGNRPAQSHSLLVQTPDVYTSLSTLAVLVQCYDVHGNSQVSQASLTITVSLPGAPSTISLSSYSMRGLTRRYHVNIPTEWFDVASVAGSTATVISTLASFDSQASNFVVYGTPSSFSSRQSSAGIAAFFTTDAAGLVPAGTMRPGDGFFMQLYAHTGGYGLTSFEVKIIENTAVCQLVPSSGSMSASYTGALQGDLSGAYQTELLTRLQSPGGTQYFTKYSRFQRLSALTSTHGHVGYIRMEMVGAGSCVSSAEITTFFHSGSTSYIPGVSTGDAVSVYGNTLASYADAAVGIFGQLNANAPIVNTAPFTGSTVSVPIYVVAFASPDSRSVSSDSVVLSTDQSNGHVIAAVSANGHVHAFNFSVVRPETPQLLVDDPILQALPGTCNSYQRTRLYASSSGVDVSRLLTFSSSNTNVATVDSSVPGHPVVVGVGSGTALIYVRDVTYASVSVTVSSTSVGLTALNAGVVTGVEWRASPTKVGPFTALTLHEFASEDATGWLFVQATYDDGVARQSEPFHAFNTPNRN